jgi:drug/metabolite transporter (DMT)-like permease
MHIVFPLYSMDHFAEPFTLSEMLAAVVSLAGVLCIARPSFLFDDSFVNAAALHTRDISWKRQIVDNLLFVKALDDRFIAVV